MSNERFPLHSSDFYENDIWQEKIDKVNTIDNEIKEKLLAIELNEYPGIETTEVRLAWTISLMRREQLNRLSEKVFQIVETHNHITGIDPENSALLADCTVPGTGLLTAYDYRLDHETRSAVTEGETTGTNDLLKHLVPEGVTDVFLRSIYFTKWRKDMLMRHFGAAKDTGDSFRISLPTRIPGLCIDFYYPSGESFPTRTIYLAD